MPHATAPAARRPDRTCAATRLFRAPRLSPLDAVSLQVIVGLVGPLPVIQIGHWLFGWDSVAVMFGAL